MDIERLTKMQIVLLALLVSFVTSIATGIVTVALMDQAPPVITQTISRVVERTVERVVPSQGASVITKEITIVVKESDLITDSIEKNSKSVVRIKKINANGEAGKLVGLGVIVSRDGMVATDPDVIDGAEAYIIEVAGGGTFNANVVNTEGEEPSVFLAIEIPEGEDEIVFSPVAFSNENTFKLGQTVISLTGEERTDVAIGIISGLIEDEVEVSVPEEETGSEVAGQTEVPVEQIMILSLIKTSIDEDDVIIGSPLIDMFGEVIGISTADSFIGRTALFKPVSSIKTTLSASQASAEETVEE